MDYYDKYRKNKRRYFNIKYNNINIKQNGAGKLEAILVEMGFNKDIVKRYEEELLRQGHVVTEENIETIIGQAINILQNVTPQSTDHKPDIIVYTTGLGYSTELAKKYSVLQENILYEIQVSYKDIIFRHYDGDGFSDEIKSIINNNNNNNIIRHEFYIENFDSNIATKLSNSNDNILIIDIARIFSYGNYKIGSNKATIYYDPKQQGINSSATDLKLDVFYPGFLLDYSNDDFIRNFRYIEINENKQIITYIDKIVYYKLILALVLDPNKGEANENVIVAPLSSCNGIVSNIAFVKIAALSKIYDFNFSNRLIWR